MSDQTLERIAKLIAAEKAQAWEEGRRSVQFLLQPNGETQVRAAGPQDNPYRVEAGTRCPQCNYPQVTPQWCVACGPVRPFPYMTEEEQRDE